MGKKGYRKHRWMVGGKLGVIVNQWGLLCAWECAPANDHETHGQPLLAQCDGQMSVLTDTGCHAQTGDPGNMQVGPRGTWNTRRRVATVWSMLTPVLHSKTMGQRVWASCRARVAWTRAVLHLVARWGMAIDEHDMIRLSIAEFGL